MLKKKHRLIMRSLIVALVITGVTFYFITICWNGLGETYVEESWKTTQATILSANTRLEDKRSRERAEQGFEQIINYEYSVNARTYRSNAVSKEQLVDAKDYPEGKVVTAYYNPSDPGDAVLLRSKVQKQYLYATITFCVLVMLATLIFLIKDIKYALNN